MGAAVVALTLVAGGVIWFASQTEETAHSVAGEKPKKPSPTRISTDGQKVWSVAAPVAGSGLEDRTVSAQGAWLTPDIYATGAPDAVTGYNPDSGKEQWSIPLSGNICAASRTQTRNGYIAVAHSKAKKVRSRCTEFALIDIDEGTTVWRASIPEAKATLGLRMSVAVSEDVAAAGWPGGSAGYRISDGQQLWDAPAPGCDSDEHTGGAQLITLSVCGSIQKVGHRDPRTGKATWRYSTRATDAWVASAEPLIVALNTGQLYEQWHANRLVAVSAQGRAQATWEIGEKYVTGCDDQSPACGAVVTTKDTLYLATDNFHDVNSITAFDIRTGRTKWTYTPDTKLSRVVAPIQGDGAGLIAYMLPTSLRGSEVLYLAAEDGKPTLLMKTPDGAVGGDASLASPPENAMFAKEAPDPAYFADGRLFLHYSGSFNLDTGAPMTMMLGTR
ncbi:PQQ-binding-like beta-propeller repeat protein [Streptomyces sp. NPDC015127]|uniref:outer membrane protein assembly factor BamB family protein n=1 Tax=Streptomyces sp. NPDC015127 TaxID=3364939 RepID=UPI0036F99CB9